MKWIILIGNEEFTLDSIKSIEHYDSVKCYDVTEVGNRYCVDYDKKGHIYYDYCDILSDYTKNELKELPFDKPHFIMMIYTSFDLIEKILTQKNFLRGIYVDDDSGHIITIEKFIELFGGYNIDEIK